MPVVKDDYVKISKIEYYKLLRDSQFLDALYEAGVDSWDGYEYAQEINSINSEDIDDEE